MPPPSSNGGGSWGNAIEIGDSSGSDDSEIRRAWPPSRRRGQRSTRADSNSPPPVIVRSNIVKTSRPAGKSAPAQNEAIPFQTRSKTQRRLLSAVAEPKSTEVSRHGETSRPTDVVTPPATRSSAAVNRAPPITASTSTPFRQSILENGADGLGINSNTPSSSVIHASPSLHAAQSSAGPSMPPPLPSTGGQDDTAVSSSDGPWSAFAKYVSGLFGKGPEADAVRRIVLERGPLPMSIGAHLPAASPASNLPPAGISSQLSAMASTPAASNLMANSELYRRWLMSQTPVTDSDLMMTAQDPTERPAEPIDADMQEMLSNMADGTFRGTDALASLYGDKGVDVARLPLYSDLEALRKRGLNTPLHTHQLQGLQWMIKAEHRRVSTTLDVTRGLWKTRKDRRGGSFYFNLASRQCVREPPQLCRGGINADSMGLGKTIQIIATCLVDRRRVPPGARPVISAAPATSSQADVGTSDDRVKGEGAEQSDESDEDSEEEYCSEDSEAEGSDAREGPGGSTTPSRKRMTSSKRHKVESPDSSDTEEEQDPIVSTRGKKNSQLSIKGEPARRNKSEVGDTESETEADTSSEADTRAGKKRKRRQEQASKGKDKAGKDKEGQDTGRYNETSLVICPLSVLQNWTGQVDTHCDKAKVSCYVHHGEQAKALRRKKNFQDVLSQYTFVFTTYDTLRNEYRLIQRREKAAEKAEEKRNAQGKDADNAGAPGEMKNLGKTTEVSLGERDPSKFVANRQIRQRRSHQKKGKGRAKSSSREGDDSDSGQEDGSDEDWSPSNDSKRKWYDSDDSLIASMSEGEEVKVDPRDIPLFEIAWRRVVLDEAHICRNPRTTLYSAICKLKGERRWAVTGTPIVNSTRDLGTLAAWCGLQPFASTPKMWTKAIESPLKKDHSAAAAARLLREVVTNICLRRHKSMKNGEGEPIVRLPDVKFYKHTIPLTVPDRDYYGKCEAACRMHLARWMEQGNVQDHASAILIFLLRLRQMSCHRRLIGAKLLEEIQTTDWDNIDKTRAATSAADVVLTPEIVTKLQDKLKVHVEMNDDCPVCMEALTGKDPIITPCGHPFCKACITAIVEQASRSAALCPMDRQVLPGLDKMVELPVEEVETVEEASQGKSVDAGEDDDAYDAQKTSAKVNECLKIIRGTLKQDATEKILVFSNFVKFLNIIGEELRTARIPHARFNGELDVKRRDAVLRRFCTPIDDRQGLYLQNVLQRLSVKMQKERAAARKAAEDGKAVEASSGDPVATSNSAASASSTGSSLLSSLRGLDRDAESKAKAKAQAAKRKMGPQDDVYGDNPV